MGKKQAKSTLRYADFLEDKEFYDCIKDVADHPIVQQMKQYPHHCDTNCYEHCLHVAYYNYKICKRMDLNAKAAARAGMLHDLFLYDWRKHAKATGNHFHGMTHPRRALKIAEKNFKLSSLERDIILKHMWPLTLVPPKYLETHVICFTDKYCGSLEIADHFKSKFGKKRVSSPSKESILYSWAIKFFPVKR